MVTGDLKWEVTAFQFREGKEGQLLSVTLDFRTIFSKEHSRAWKTTSSVAIQEIFWIIWIGIIAIFTVALHFTLSSARWILSMTLRPIISDIGLLYIIYAFQIFLSSQTFL